MKSIDTIYFIQKLQIVKSYYPKAQPSIALAKRTLLYEGEKQIRASFFVQSSSVSSLSLLIWKESNLFYLLSFKLTFKLTSARTSVSA